MKKKFIVEKCFMTLFLSSTLFAQKMEFRTLDQGGTAVRGIANNGDAVLSNYTYSYENKTIIPKESLVRNYTAMNSQGDLLAIGTINGKIQPIYKKANSEEWLGTGVFDGYTGSSINPYSISNNGRFITGQMNSVPFLYDTELLEMHNLKPEDYKYGAGYGVNNDGTVVGWLDKALNGTFRELAVIPFNRQVEIILSDYAIPVNNHIWHIEDNGIVVGDVDKKPFMYNLNTKEFKIFDVPAGYDKGSFGYSSNGILVGVAENSPGDRDAIIYHPSFGNNLKLIKDLLLEQGIEITIPGGKLGAANVISDNGDFIGGMEPGNGNIAPGWILKLNGYFDIKECNIHVPSDIEIQAQLGETSAVVNYDVTTDCSDYKLVLVNGLESGSEFPMGVTTITYHLLNSEGKVVDSASFKVLVKDSYCTPRFSIFVEPITDVKIGTINNTTSSSLTANQNEYFFDQSTDLEQGKTYYITVAGNTNGSERNEFVVFFDFDQNGAFEPDSEGYYIGAITNSTGEDGKTVTKSIQTPAHAKEGKTRMRIMKTYRLVPDDPCSLTYAYGQSEDYLVNITSNLATDDIHTKTLRIYPNPVRNKLIIESRSVVKSVKIINMTGQEIYKKQINQANTQLDLSNLSKGIYMINIETNEGITTQKIIKD